MKAIFYVSLMTLFCQCNYNYSKRIPIKSGNAANNATYKVDYLFEHDGCKVYRFNDFGNLVYFTSCSGNSIAFIDSNTVIKNQTIRKN